MRAAGATAGGRGGVHQQSVARRRGGGRCRHHALDRADQSAGPAGYFLTRVEHAADIVGKVGSPNLRIQFDFYHAQIVGGDLIRRFEAHLPLVGHVQIAAVPSRCEPDEGEVNYPEIFAALDRLGYAGFVGCEYRPRGRTEDGLAWARPYGIARREPGAGRV